MMHRLIATCLVLLFCASVCLAGTGRSEGKCSLQEAGAFDDGKHVIATFGDKLKGRAKFYIDDFFGKPTIMAGATIKNPTGKPMRFYYYVAFYDKDGKLLGCTGQGSFGDEGLKPGKDMTLGSCLIHLPMEVAKSAARYSIVLYEMDAKKK